MSGTDKRKQSLYFPDEMLQEIHREATRLDRSFSWVVQKAWEIARARLVQVPAATVPQRDAAAPSPSQE